MGEQGGKLGIYLPLGVVTVELVETLKHGNSAWGGSARSQEHSPLMRDGGAKGDSVRELAYDAACGVSGYSSSA